MRKHVAPSLAFVLGGLAGPLGAQVPRFPARVETVELSVLVRGPDGPIPGLRVEDFDVRDNGVTQRAELVRSEALPLNVILAFDVSGSVKGEKLAELRRASHALLAGLQPGDRAALLTFADTLRLRAPLGADLPSLRARLDELDAEGGTSLRDGTFAAMALGDEVRGRLLAVVFTDGEETVSWLPEKDVLDTAARTEVVVYGVHVGEGGPGVLARVTAATGGRLLSAPSPDRLRPAFLDILGEFRNRYLLRFTPQGVPRKGLHRVEVRVKGRAAKVLARTGYLVSP